MNKPLCFFDLETTGLDILKDRIVEIACIKFFEDGIIQEKHTLVNPTIPIPKEVTEIHGITNEAVANKPTFKQLSKSIHDFIKDADIAGFNSNTFDVPLLYAEFNRCGIDWDWQASNLIDVRNIFKRKEPRNLTSAMKFYCNSGIKDAHSALHDARATMKVFAEQCRKYDMNSIEETALYSSYDKKIADLSGWFDYDEKGGYILARGKSKGTRDSGFINWMLQKVELFPDTKKICYQILNEDK